MCHRNLTIVMLASLVVLAGACCATEYKFEKLGAPLTQRDARASFVAQDPEGRYVAWGTIEAAGQQAIFGAYLDNGETIWMDMAPYRPMHFILHPTSNGDIYAYGGAPGHFFKFDWKLKKFVDLGIPAEKSGYLLGYAAGKDGRIYVGVGPEARLLCLDPKTDKGVDLGRMSDDPRQAYLLNLAVSDEDVAYCPVGLHHPELWAYDIQTGQKKQLLTPELQASMAEKKIPMARVWLEKDGRVFADLAGKVGLCKPDAIDFNETSLGRRGGLNTRPEKANPLSAGDEVVSPTMSEGKLEITNSKTKQARTVQSKVTGLGVAIYSLGSELDGKLYGGGLKPAKTFEVDLATGQMRDLGVLGLGKTQVYHVLAHGGGLYQSSYAEGSITYYDPKQPIEKGVNPKEIITLAKTDDQERAQELVVGPDGMIYAGTIPVKGQLGGVLLRIDPADKSTKVWRNLVPNQSLISMESVPATGEMFVTTTIGGGSSAIPTEKEAVAFLWNCKEEKISWQGKPVPGAISYGKAVLARNGLLYGLVDRGAKYYVFDPVKRETVYVADLPRKDVRWRGLFRHPAGPDGFIYGSAKGVIFAIDPNDNSVKTIAKHESLEATEGDIYVTDNGVLYYSSDADMWRVDLYPHN